MSEISPASEFNKVPETKQIQLEMSSSTVASEYHPNNNEDKCFFNNETKSFGVFDGMGGEADAEEAAKICLKRIGQHLQTVPEKSNRTNVEFLLRQAYDQANQELLKKSSAEKATIGSTATYGLIYKNEIGNYEAAIANSGDSRAYLFRDGTLTKITQDHSFIRYHSGAQASELERVLDNASQASMLTSAQLEIFKKRNMIFNHVGNQNGSIDVFYQAVKPGDIILLSTDGVHDNLTTSEISSIIAGNKDKNSSLITQELIGHSVRRSKDKSLRSKKDDMTALVIKVNSPDSNSKSESNSEKQSTYLPKVGDKINVERSSGIIEPGWNVFYIDQDEGRLLVTKKDPETGQLIRKKIKIELAQRLNTPAKSEHISQAETLPQLFHTLRGIGGIQGSSEFFPSNYLIEIIQAVKSGRKNVNTITRTYGLRDTVQKLIEKGK